MSEANEQDDKDCGSRRCSTDNGVWYPLCGLIEQGEDIPIMVSCGRGPFQGESHEATSKRFQQLMADHNFELEHGWIVKNMQTDRFIEVMNQAGWKCAFLPIGP